MPEMRNRAATNERSGSRAAPAPSAPGRATAPSTVRRGRSRQTRLSPSPTPPEPGWYKEAIIYELHVRAFADSDADGIGDFPGLNERLDYLHDLGVTAIWLLPFYPSPLRDDGYDIASYTGVNPAYGARRDVRRLISEAHKRGLRIITELVINHTSDQHPWFKRARKAARGSPERDFYVWADEPTGYPEARIIFQDFETSNWTYDPVAGQYFWHRFYHHQPDLNFDNPAVHDAVFRVMDKWFELGVDGMRLDAVPYLYEREGTNCENLPETHEFLRKLRRHVDTHWPGRMLLAEANQWPEDSAAYFGDGDECHMCFHFPLMPRLFMGLRMEDRFPIVDILQQTPALPEPCQWAIFLRNHDELTLEMVTDEERDYMYRSYATDRQMRINLGIRRRLAPLLENNRRKIELLNGLLFSMPGTPVLYYGDEIGMGDNVYLGDRDSVRTPMQWSDDRNAGFSRANPQQLYLPTIIDPEYHYETVNVESQRANQSSLLWWMKRLIALRKRHAVFGRGDIEFLNPDNPRILAFLRRHEDEHILIIANLSRFAQPVQLELSAYAGQEPIELFGHTRFPPIGGGADQPYFLSLGPHAFHWFRLRSAASIEISTGQETPEVSARGDLNRWLTSPAAARWLESVLPDDLPTRRWFASKSRAIRAVTIEESLPIPLNLDPATLTAAIFLVRVQYADSDDEMYTVPLALADREHAALLLGESSPAICAYIGGPVDDGRARTNGAALQRRVLYDATVDPYIWTNLLLAVQRRRTLKGGRGEAQGIRSNTARSSHHRGRAIGESDRARTIWSGAGATPDEVHLGRTEQSNSSVTFGDRYIMKLYRRLQEGLNPDLEIGRFLTERTGFSHAPPVAGSLHYVARRQEPMTLAMVQGFVPNQGDCWRFTIDALGRSFERILTLPPERAQPPTPPGAEPDLFAAARAAPDPAAEDLLGDFLDQMRLLGRRTAEMHTALASDDEDPAFKPESFSRLYQRSLYQSMRNGAQRALQTLRGTLRQLDDPTRTLAEQVLERRDQIMERLRRVTGHLIDTVRIRCHGDYHLGQVLWTGRDVVMIDFEGEPMRPISERRLKRSALMDVAGMIRSFQYAAHEGVREQVQRGAIPAEGDEAHRFGEWAAWWRGQVQAAFFRGYLEHIKPPIIPAEESHARLLLDVWLLNKAAYELTYELNNRPSWAPIPMNGILELLDRPQ